MTDWMFAEAFWQEQMPAGVAEFLLTYWLHSSVLIGASLIAIRARLLVPDIKAEALLKVLLVLAIASSLLTMLKPQALSLQLPWQLAMSVPQKLEADTQNPSTLATNEQVKNADDNKAIVATNASYNEIIANNQTEIAAGSDPANVRTRLHSVVDNLNLPWILCALWLLGALCSLIAKLCHYQKLQRILQDRDIVESLSLIERFLTVKQSSGIDHQVALTESDRLSSPLALSAREIVLPTNFAQQYSDTQQAAALAHEMAHIKCGDLHWKKLILLLDVVFFFQPLNRGLSTHLINVVEQRSDLLASQWTGDARALAEALSIAAESNLNQQQNAWVFAMKAQKSQLLMRVEQLLQPSQQSKSMAVRSIAALSVALALIAPGFSFDASQSEYHSTLVDVITQQGHAQEVEHAGVGHNYSSTRVEEFDEHTRFSMKTRNDKGSLQISAYLNGQLAFAQDDSAISFFPTNSKMDIQYSDDQGSRRLIIKRAEHETEYLYYQDKQELPYAEEAEGWLADLLPDILQSTGWYATERVERILAHEGAYGVLSEIEKTKGDHVTSIYFEELLKQTQLDDTALFKAIGISAKIKSDFSHANTLIALVNTQLLNQQHWFAVLEQGKHFESDFEQARLFKQIADKMPKQDALLEAFFYRATGVESDFEMASLFSHILDSGQMSETAVVALLISAAHVESDYELASLLIKVSEKMGQTSDSLNVFLDVSEDIESDFEMRRVYSSLLRRNVPEPALLAMLDSAQRKIDSDFELASLLVDVLSDYPVTPSIAKALEDATQTISSDFEKERVLTNISKLLLKS